jgi:hypothetical protein
MAQTRFVLECLVNLASHHSNSKIVLDIARLLLGSTRLESCIDDVFCGQGITWFFESLFDAYKTPNSILEIFSRKRLEEPISLLDELAGSSRSALVASFALLGMKFVHSSNK